MKLFIDTAIVDEIREGKFEALIESLMQKPLAEIKELYDAADKIKETLK